MGCWAAGQPRYAVHSPITTLLVVVVVVALNLPQPRSAVQQAISEHRGLALAPHLLIRDAS